jgi:hypothetical protein
MPEPVTTPRSELSERPSLSLHGAASLQSAGATEHSARAQTGRATRVAAWNAFRPRGARIISMVDRRLVPAPVESKHVRLRVEHRVKALVH